MKSRFAKIVLTAAALAWVCSSASAQTTGGTGGTGAGGAGGGAAAGAGANPGGVGGNASGSFGTNVGTSSDVFGVQGLGSTNFTGGSGQTTISKSNPFYYYYASPLSAGFGPNVNLVPQNSLSFSSSTGGSTAGGTLVTGKGTFGAAMANITTSTTGGKGATGGGGGGGGVGGGANVTTNFNTIGTKRAPSYMTTVDPGLRIGPTSVGMAQIQQNMRTALQTSTSLPSGQNLNAQLEGDTVVLTGTVATERERRLAENLVALDLTPGVRNVRNQIQVGTTSTSPRP